MAATLGPKLHSLKMGAVQLSTLGTMPSTPRDLFHVSESTRIYISITVACPDLEYRYVHQSGKNLYM